MEYTYDNIYISVKSLKCAREEQYIRLFVYSIKLLPLLHNRTIIEEKKSGSNISLQSILFWDRESILEQKLYGRMKKWEIRHPIMGIVTCTILGGILISLVAGIILEAIIMVL